ncbi:unnamed protein product [Rangifer tarandus platyrhynchus]|uniref:Uncharacterized protein n=2 Tax=Rangifer tarandus platyrhynchus TaxID=3082113 RepID=A0ABN8YG74_RANTA|nr:unnamed protein product [Rangifer tarandus platyrhynchus]CAI9698572.1 unnamed protein product [Rangifer tarandus platyrhynchus]
MGSTLPGGLGVTRETGQGEAGSRDDGETPQLLSAVTPPSHPHTCTAVSCSRAGEQARGHPTPALSERSADLACLDE